MKFITITAAELKVGDVFRSGGRITEVKEITIPGYNVKRISVKDDKQQHPVVGVQFQPDAVLTVQRT